MMFDPTRTAALARLTAFVARAGRDYAALRNYDRTGLDNVSRLSPYLRHRMITEDEVLKVVLARHSPSTAEKFIQEVYWRTYWKGWLEQRPPIWHSYRAGLNGALNNVQTQSGLRANWEAACAGDTGIACFDHWARQLADTGYLHNHARMWFASIWIFTLRLPWELGADFFMRHLIDGDAASNTLGWRWVAGLQTIGKTYLARPDNIAKYTDGQFRPTGLATWAVALDGPPHPDRSELPASDAIPTGKLGLLITEDDMTPDWLLDQFTPANIAVFNGTPHRSPLMVAPMVQSFVEDAIADLSTRIGPFDRPASAVEIDDWARKNGLDGIVMSHAPVGGTADVVAQITTPVIHRIRPYDTAAWPHASAGFFKFKTKIPELLGRYDDQLSLL